ncbi:transmembrane protein 209 isoform X2 [Agrilus planipennis]|uniref:Transmembrane protein 209 isoform X2 n=1 Tax=Agrilus planipennis TaxID=224129 RepID=A0A1W4XG07_AGRPL|nr:transmembrane protein 209 isoform X2 [Agrilus planipennis]
MTYRRYAVRTPTKRETSSISKRAEFSPALSKIFQESERQRKIQKCITWGTINTCILLLILFDLAFTCTLHASYIQTIEYFLSGILSLNILYYIICCPGVVFKYETLDVPPVESPKKQSPEQLIPPSNTVTSFHASKDSSPNFSILRRTPTSSFSSTPINLSAASWRSTPGSMYSPFRQNKSQEERLSADNLLLPNTSDIENISDSQSLNQYLSTYEEYDKLSNISKPAEPTNSLLNSFWNYPGMKSGNDVSPLFKRTQYQLSFMPVSSSSPGANSDDRGSPKVSLQSLEVWKQINVDPHMLTRWTGNLRSWISKTILERIMREINLTNEKLEQNGLGDVCIGRASLETLRKNSQTPAVLQFAPTLPTLVPFLEVTSNQEYLIKRIRDLTKGGSMSEFKWNGGCSFKGKQWDDSLPTDAQIIMHLFVSYMDAQLIPLPNKPDAKPFSSSHFIKSTERTVELTSNTIALREFMTKPPHYQVIIGDKVYEVSKGYNNLFHSILLFLYYVNAKEDGMLGSVNLGRSGLNILWIIQS